jgi:hypothetical protein
MANDFVFTSPGVKFKERDLSFVTRNVGITTLGLVGETEKGPAFEPVFVEDAGQFRDRFGNQSIKKLPDGNLQYELPYVANAYLEESSQLYVTRVLGLSGYDAGTAWAITLSAGVDLSTTGETTSTTTTDNFSNNIYRGVPLFQSGDTGSQFTGFTKVTDTTFQGLLYEFTATTVNNGTGTTFVKITTLTGTSYTDYENMVLAVIRSRASVDDDVDLPPETIFEATNLIVSGNTTTATTGDLFAQFTLVASKPTDPEDEPESYTVTLDPNSSSFLPNVIGREPKDKTTKIWVEAIYPDLIKKLDADGIGFGINDDLIDASSDVFTNYKTGFKTPETPWVVSQLKGSQIDRLFKFISISDGNSANKEIKISITNIKPDSKEFDVVVRDFNDTDSNPTVLETFSRCTMMEGENSFIGQRIGTSNGDYDLQSNYIMVELTPDIPEDVFPAGFEGFIESNWATTITESSVEGVAPKILYKTEYDPSERFNRVYLGVSELAYSSTNLVGTGVNQNIFNFNGWKTDGGNVASGFTKSMGFHMDSGATGTYYDGTYLIGQFEVGAGRFQTVSDISSSDDTYFDLRTRKFTVVPAGGFDGWDVHRNSRSNTDFFRQNGPFDGVAPNTTPRNDFQAWETAINTFANPEEVTINLFATPGIDWSEQNVLVRDTIDMIENERTDTLYIIDTPDVSSDFNTLTIGETRPDVVAANDIVDLLDTAEIDSSYAATYFPKIQIRDTQNNVNIYLPPTGEVVKAMAFTDNTKFPWFAPAGLTRGITDARKSQFKLSLEARDVLYAGRINPLADFADVGTAIFGQKTLQVRESALDRINVRRLLLQVKVLISNIATRLVFEQNDQATIDQFIQKATPILDNIKRERGLQEFRIKMDDSNNTPETRDRNELYGEIFLKPTRAVEFIGITFTITPSGASFDEAGA